jgi:hypothetical protein
MAQTVLRAISLYLSVGVCVALVLIPLLGRIDPAARGAYGFRVLIAPGAVLLWPLVIWCTLRALRRLPSRGAP